MNLPRSAPAEQQLAAAPSARPPADALAEAQRLIELGAMSDLMDWAENLGAREPECALFAHELRQLARRGDLVALQSLCRV